MSSLRLNFFDTFFTDSLTAAGILTPLTLVPSGEGDQTRLSDSLQLLKLDKNILYDIPDQATASPAGDAFRCLVVYDSQPNAGVPTIADGILQTYSGAIPAFYAHPNYDNDNRYTIMVDEVTSVNPAGMVAAHNIQTIHAVKCSVDLSELPRTIFTPGATTVLTGALYIIFIPAYALVAGHVPTVFCNSRVWYKFL